MDDMVVNVGPGDPWPEEAVSAAAESIRKTVDAEILQKIEQLCRARDIGIISNDTLIGWIFPPVTIDLDWDPDEVTEPMGPTAEQVAASERTRAQRKKDGVCPECGDVKNEVAVGICRVHGKFLGK